MGDMGELFNDLRELGKEKRNNNYNKSIELLKAKGISFEYKNEYHLLVGDFNYWPSTGLYIHRKSKKRGRGVFNLIKILGRS